MSDFRFKTKLEYEKEIDKWFRKAMKKPSYAIPPEYDELVDEYVEFCEVSGSGE